MKLQSVNSLRSRDVDSAKHKISTETGLAGLLFRSPAFADYGKLQSKRGLITVSWRNFKLQTLCHCTNKNHTLAMQGL